MKNRTIKIVVAVVAAIICVIAIVNQVHFCNGNGIEFMVISPN